ncbi:MAG: TolC family protein [Saprospiraceae bacterium]|nr:TolC family protein [Saprospiraceae bacterium]
MKSTSSVKIFPKRKRKACITTLFTIRLSVKKGSGAIFRNGLLALFYLTFFLSNAKSQNLDWPTFRRQVLDNHPLAKQANLYRNQAEAALLRAKGGFDPKAYTDLASKNFNDKQYFQHTEAGLKWPTWLGLELKGTYNYASGQFLNPEANLPSNGQANFGFNWTLGQGLFIDDRRAGLRQARIGLQQGEAERAAALNDLLLEAAKVYWNWVAAENTVRVYSEALRQAELRNAAIRESFLQGERSGMDTLETFIQLQNRLLDVNFAQVDVQNTLLALQVFLWETDNEVVETALIPPSPALLAGEFVPLPPQSLLELAQQATIQHPTLRLYDAKLRSLDVERRLKNEYRKPVFDLNYYLLGNGWQFFPTAGTEGIGVFGQDMKWGLNFSYPLLNRKARGDLQVTQIKIAQTDFELRQKRQDIENKVQQYANELNTLAAQISLYRNVTTNYRTLLDAEIERFNFGESTVFLVNTREQLWLDAQIKFLKLLSEYRKAEAGLQWSAGALAN